jgi:hypothetical protein
MHETRPARDPIALRGEHDALADKLAARRSVDRMREAAYVGFASVIAIGLSIKLAWDRWGPLRPGAVRKIYHGPPLFLFLAVIATIVLGSLAVRALVLAARLRREEDALFARMRALRAELGLDP